MFAAESRRGTVITPPPAPADGEGRNGARRTKLDRLAAEAERIRRERSGELAAVEAWRANRRADLAARVVESRLRQRVHDRFDNEESRLESLGAFLSGP